MVTFSVKDMNACDSAVAIVKAVKHVDEGASVFVNMARHGVAITLETAGTAALRDAIVDAGFTPELMPSGFTRTDFVKPPKIPFEGPDHDFTAGPLL